MFSITVEHAFTASHALLIKQVREPLHFHDWHVTAAVEGPFLDGDGLLWDFHALHQDLVEATAGFQNADLGRDPSFSDGVNPSAEAVAREIAVRLERTLESRLEREPKTSHNDRWPVGLRLAWVRVTEAPGCTATYMPNVKNRHPVEFPS